MLKLVFDDLIMVSNFSVRPNFCRAWFWNSGLEAALMCLDWLRLPSGARIPNIGLCISTFKVVRKMFSFCIALQVYENCIIILKKQEAHTYVDSLSVFALIFKRHFFLR